MQLSKEVQNEFLEELGGFKISSIAKRLKRDFKLRRLKAGKKSTTVGVEE
jgi:hypothetical protein